MMEIASGFGLSDEEYFGLQMKIKTPMISVQDYIDAMRMVEAKLKQKNGYAEEKNTWSSRYAPFMAEAEVCEAIGRLR